MKLGEKTRLGLGLILIAFLLTLIVAMPVHAAEEWQATDTYRIMNFAVLVLILFFILRKPVANFFTDRVRLIKEQLEDLEKQKVEAENKLAEYNEKLSALDAEAEKIIQEYQRQGEEARTNILKQAETAATKLEQQARKSIEQEFKQAKLQLETELFDAAVQKAEDRMKGDITKDDHERLVTEYLDKVVKK